MKYSLIFLKISIWHIQKFSWKFVYEIFTNFHENSYKEYSLIFVKVCIRIFTNFRENSYMKYSLNFMATLDFWLKMGKNSTYITQHEEDVLVRRCIGLNEAEEIVLVTDAAHVLCALQAEVEAKPTFIHDRLQGMSSSIYRAPWTIQKYKELFSGHLFWI